MPVILAKSAGFCYGVERAVKLAEQTAREKGGCVMLGSIIHNAHVVRELEALGARQADDVPQIQPGETVIIRSHGERKQVYEALAAIGADIVDATCPNVRRIQRLVARAGEEGRIPGRSLTYGRQEDPASQAQALFDALRMLDELGAQRVFARCPNREGVGLAVYNRLLRAAAFEEIAL